MLDTAELDRDTASTGSCDIEYVDLEERGWQMPDVTMRIKIKQNR